MRYDIRNMNIWKEVPEKKKGQSNEYRDIRLEDLNLSVRSFNSLKRGSCSTVGDILDLMDEDGNGLRRIRNLGARSETEIKEKLEEIRTEYARKTGGAQLSGCGEKSGDSEMEEQESGGRKIVLYPAKRVWEREIGEFQLSHHSEDRLRRCGISRIKDLYATHPKQEPGWYAVRELLRKIAENG